MLIFVLYNGTTNIIIIIYYSICYFILAIIIYMQLSIAIYSEPA